jgi:SAM-dependent methyltransferase
MSFHDVNWSSETFLQYHLNQWQKPKESTIVFADFIRDFLVDADSVVDLGCGTGAATAFLARSFTNTKWIGIDSNEKLVTVANDLASNLALDNLSFENGDFVSSPLRPSLGNAISLQTLSWLPDFNGALSNVLSTLKPSWFAFSSLFYEGDISAMTRVYLHKTHEVVHYNTISLPSLSRLAEDLGYSISKYHPFDIPIALSKPSNQDIMGTYTLDVAENESHNSRRIQISGPVLMSWYNVCLVSNH